MDADRKWITVAELAAKLRLTVQRVYQLIEKEQMPHLPRGEDRAEILVDEDEVLRWLYARAMTRAPDPEAEDRKRKRKLEADRLQIELDTLKGQRLDRAECDAFTRGQEGAFFAFLTGQLQRFEPEIRTAVTPVDARRLTQRMLREILEARRNYADELEAEAMEMEALESSSRASRESAVRPDDEEVA